MIETNLQQINKSGYYNHLPRNDRLDAIRKFIGNLSPSDLDFARKLIHETQMKRFNVIPDEILILIFTFISDIHDINQCRLSCRRWYRILKENMIWKSVCKRNGYNHKLIKNHIMWSRIFKYHYLTAKNWKKGNFSVRHISTYLEHNAQSGFCTAFDDNWVISLNFGPINQGKVWNYHTGEEKIRISGHTASISVVEFNKNLIISGSVDSTLKIWNWSGECIQTLRGHSNEITCISITHQYIISGSEDQTIRIWNTKNKTCDKVLEWHTGSIICLKTNGNILVVGSADKTLSIWNLKSKALEKTLVGHTGAVQCVSVTPNLIVSGSHDTSIRLWNSRGTCIGVLSGHSSLVICLIVDKEKIISGSADTTIKVWDLKSRYCMYTLKNHTSPVWNLYATPNYLISSAFDQSLLKYDFSHVEV